MAFDFGRALGGAAIGGLLGGPGAAAGAYIGGTGKSIMPTPDDPGNAPGMDPRYTDLVNKQQQQAQDFRQQAPEMQAQQTRQAQDTSRRSVSQDIAGVNKDTSRRGLLYSGINQGQQQQARQQETQALTQNVANIQSNIEGKAQDLEGKALSSMQTYTAQQQAANNADLQKRVAVQQANNSATSGLFGGLGSVLGGIFG